MSLAVAGRQPTRLLRFARVALALSRSLGFAEQSVWGRSHFDRREESLEACFAVGDHRPRHGISHDFDWVILRGHGGISGVTISASQASSRGMIASSRAWTDGGWSMSSGKEPCSRTRSGKERECDRSRHRGVSRGALHPATAQAAVGKHRGAGMGAAILGASFDGRLCRDVAPLLRGQLSGPALRCQSERLRSSRIGDAPAPFSDVAGGHVVDVEQLLVAALFAPDSLPAIDGVGENCPDRGVRPASRVSVEISRPVVCSGERTPRLVRRSAIRRSPSPLAYMEKISRTTGAVMGSGSSR